MGEKRGTLREKREANWQRRDWEKSEGVWERREIEREVRGEIGREERDWDRKEICREEMEREREKKRRSRSEATRSFNSDFNEVARMVTRRNLVKSPVCSIFIEALECVGLITLKELFMVFKSELE